MNKRLILKILTLTLLGSAAACVTDSELDRTLGTWVGRDADDLVRQWGAPNSTYALKDGGKIIGYERLTVQTTGSEDFRDTESRYCKIDLTVDGEGKITNAMWRGSNEQCGVIMSPADDARSTPESSPTLQPSPAPSP